MSPYISVDKEEVYILGESEALIAIGELLILKGKLKKNFSATFYDGVNIPIKIECREDLPFQG